MVGLDSGVYPHYCGVLYWHDDRGFSFRPIHGIGADRILYLLAGIISANLHVNSAYL